MRLLLDQNLSRRLVPRLTDLYPGSIHVSSVGLVQAVDRALWEAARDGDHVLVTEDTDFDDPARFPGPPPKVVRLAIGNGPTDLVESALRRNADEIREFALDDRRLLVIAG